MPASRATTGAKDSIASPGTTMLVKPHLSRRSRSRSHNSSVGADQDDRKLERVLTRKAEHGCGARGSAAAGDDSGGNGHDLELDRTEPVRPASRTQVRQRS